MRSTTSRCFRATKRRRRNPRGSARHTVALGRGQGRKDQELSGGCAFDLECQPARCLRRSRSLRSLAAAHAARPPEEPLEVLRTVHSFDPCMACACHTFDPSGRQIAKVKVL
jgi:hypothetical protein